MNIVTLIEQHGMTYT